jgi:hypothetical protein
VGVLTLPFLLLLAALADSAPMASHEASAPGPDRSVKIDPVVLDDIAVTAEEPRFVAPTAATGSGASGRRSASTARARFASCSTPARATPP